MRTGYTGNDGTCTAGDTSAASRAATLRALNFVRSLSGLTPVAFSPELNARAQQTALMLSAQNAVSHHPDTSWKCYTPTGAANAAVANLAVTDQGSMTSALPVGMYMTELGTSNTPVGHRRWLMNPFATTMGSGATNSANAITVYGGATNAANPNPTWVSWPTPNHFPAPLEPRGRWSLSSGFSDADFSAATVQMIGPKGAVPLTVYPTSIGYAQPTLTWQAAISLDLSATYQVTVANIRVGNTITSHSYSVRLFQPS